MHVRDDEGMFLLNRHVLDDLSKSSLPLCVVKRKEAHLISH